MTSYKRARTYSLAMAALNLVVTVFFYALSRANALAGEQNLPVVRMGAGADGRVLPGDGGPGRGRAAARRAGRRSAGHRAASAAQGEER